MEAVVLAGGKGTRLRGVVSGIPKPMAEIRGRPFLQYVLDHLATQGVGRSVLAVGYKHEVVREFFGDAYRDMTIVYSIEDEPRGTGGALRHALALVEQEHFLAMNGDTLFKIPLRKLFDFHHRADADLTVALKRMPDCGRYGSVDTDSDGRIASFKEKQSGRSGSINGGAYIIRRQFVAERDSPDSFSFEQDVLEQLYPSHPFYGLEFDDYFIDIGVPEDYERAARELTV